MKQFFSDNPEISFIALIIGMALLMFAGLIALEVIKTVHCAV